MEWESGELNISTQEDSHLIYVSPQTFSQAQELLDSWDEIRQTESCLTGSENFGLDANPESPCPCGCEIPESEHADADDDMDVELESPARRVHFAETITTFGDDETQVNTNNYHRATEAPSKIFQEYQAFVQADGSANHYSRDVMDEMTSDDDSGSPNSPVFAGAEAAVATQAEEIEEPRENEQAEEFKEPDAMEVDVDDEDDEVGDDDSDQPPHSDEPGATFEKNADGQWQKAWLLEKILDSRRDPDDGRLWYQVKWQGSNAPNYTTWEPYESIKDCVEFLADFHYLNPRKPHKKVVHPSSSEFRRPEGWQPPRR